MEKYNENQQSLFVGLGAQEFIFRVRNRLRPHRTFHDEIEVAAGTTAPRDDPRAFLQEFLPENLVQLLGRFLLRHRIANIKVNAHDVVAVWRLRGDARSETEIVTLFDTFENIVKRNLRTL